MSSSNDFPVTMSAYEPEGDPAAPRFSVSDLLNLRFGLGALGAAIVAAGVFLPEVSAPVPVMHNSIITAEAATGIFGLLLAMSAAIVSFRERHVPALQIALLSLGALLTASAVWAGTGDRVDLHASGRFADLTIHGSAGIGVWAVGVGGILIVLAGLARARATESPAVED
jgi:hypothetical protein